MVTLPKSPPLPPDQTTIYRFPFGSIWVALQKTWLVPIDWVRKAGAIGVTSRAVRLYVRVKALRPLTTLTWPSRALRAEHPPSVHRSSSQSSKKKKQNTGRLTRSRGDFNIFNYRSETNRRANAIHITDQ